MEGNAWFRKGGICGQCGREIQHRDACCYYSSPLHTATPLNSSLYDSGALQTAVPLLEPKVSAATKILCPGPSRVLSPFSPGLVKSLLIFTARYLCGLLFLALVLWAREPGVGWRPLTTLGQAFAARYPYGFSPFACGGRARPFQVSAPPAYCSQREFLCKSLVQLVFRWLFRLIIPYFSC